MKNSNHSRLSYFKNNNYKIYSFNEWCTKMNYVFPVDKILDRICELTYPTYVECIKSKSSSYELGKIYKVNEKGDVISGINPTSKWNNTNDFQSTFKPSTTDDWNAQEINKTNIDQFTKKYPIKNPYNTNLIKVLYVRPKQKTISKEKIKKVKFLNVNIIKIN